MSRLRGIFLKIVSIYEILGGMTGAAVILFSIVPVLIKQSARPNILFLYFIVVIFLLLFVLSILGGFFLWRNKGVGYLFSFIVQLIQIPYLVTSILVYTFIAGFSITPYISSRGIGITFYLGGRFLFYVGHAVLGYRLGVNLLALFLAIWILVEWKRFQSSINAE